MCWIYVSEIPTAWLRSLNIAIAAATQWLFHFAVARAIPNMLAAVGKGGYGYVVPPPSFASVSGWVGLLTAATGVSRSMALSAIACSSSPGS